VAVKILTGDNELVTRKICRDVGIDVEHLLTGPQLLALPPGEPPFCQSIK
jgi:Mg2+-importing ATPase